MRLSDVTRAWRFAGAAMVLFAGVSWAEPTHAPKRGQPLTEADVTASNQKLAGAYPALVRMWTDQLAGIGHRFVVPRLVRYRGGARTACGLMGSGNAGYCSDANAIYYDEVFVARQEKAAGGRLGTDGDMAGIGIIAHEMGHAGALQLGVSFRDSYDNESPADCLAGAFAKQARRDGSLENGDLDEAFFGMAAAGDPPVELAGDPRGDNPNRSGKH